MTKLAHAIERHRAAQAAIDAADGPEGYPKHLSDEEDEALDELAFTPCASDAEFLEKLRYLYAQQAKIWDSPHVTSVRCRHDPPSLSRLKAPRAVLGLAAAGGRGGAAGAAARGGEFAAKNKQRRYCEDDY